MGLSYVHRCGDCKHEWIPDELITYGEILCPKCESKNVVVCGSLITSLVTDHDPVNHPSHYTAHPSGVECIQITEHMNFCIGNAVKYLWRADLKNGIEDLEKAAWYVNREIERRKKSE